MRAPTALAAALIVAAAAYYAWPSEGTTAGDDESNNLLDAVETMTSKLTGWPPGSEPYRELITWAANLHSVPVMILAWLIWKESRYLPEVISGQRKSRVGALGIAQFMPATAREELGAEAYALDPDHAIPGAARYLAKLYRGTGTWMGALAAYNWGIGNVQRKGLSRAPAETVDYYTTILDRAGEYA